MAGRLTALGDHEDPLRIGLRAIAQRCSACSIVIVAFVTRSSGVNAPLWGMADATGLSQGYCSFVRRGQKLPHWRQWPTLATLGVEQRG